MRAKNFKVQLLLLKYAIIEKKLRFKKSGSWYVIRVMFVSRKSNRFARIKAEPNRD